MHRSELHQYPSDGPLWELVARLGAARFTGQVDVGVERRVQLFVADGRIYVAQHADDAPLGDRLVAAGALTAQQLQQGEVRVGDNVSLARLFERVADADRDVVQVALIHLNDAVLEPVAQQPAGAVAVVPLRHHASGAHLWDRELAALPTAAADDDDVVAIVGALQHADDTPKHVDDTPEHVDDTPAAPVQASSPMSLPPLVLPTLGAVGSRVAPPPDGSATSPGLSKFTPADMETLVLPKLSSRPMSMNEITAAHAVVEPDALAPVEVPATQEIWEMVDEMLGIPHTDEALVTAGPSAASAAHVDDRKSRGWLRGRRG
jgi:hypothetical protein